MDSSEPTQKECDSSAEDMARVPFVGRLHPYLPHFPSKSFSYFHYSSLTSKSPEATASSDDVPTPPLTPAASEPGKELQEIEPREYEEEEILEEEILEDISACSSSLWKRKSSDAYTEEDSVANVRPFMEKNSQEYLALAFSFLFLVFEGILRVITIALREFSPFSLFLALWSRVKRRESGDASLDVKVTSDESSFVKP